MGFSDAIYCEVEVSLSNFSGFRSTMHYMLREKYVFENALYLTIREISYAV